MKPIFFSSFLVLEPTADVFSRDRPRFFPFYRLFPFPFSHFESNFRRFFDGTSLFSAPKLTFSLLFPVLPHASGTSSRDPHPLFSPRSPFCTARRLFRFVLPFLSHLPHLHFPTTVFPPLIHPTFFTPSPTFFLIPPHFSISLPNKRTIARTLAHYARTRTPAHPHTSRGFRLLPSPLHPPFATSCAPTH